MVPNSSILVKCLANDVLDEFTFYSALDPIATSQHRPADH